jgi:hypothetical protein
MWMMLFVLFDHVHYARTFFGSKKDSSCGRTIMSAAKFLMAAVLADFVESLFAQSEAGDAGKISKPLTLAPSLYIHTHFVAYGAGTDLWRVVRVQGLPAYSGAMCIHCRFSPG